MTPQRAQYRLLQLRDSGMLWPATLAEAQALATLFQIPVTLQRTDLNSGQITLIDLSTGEVKERTAIA